MEDTGYTSIHPPPSMHLHPSTSIHLQKMDTPAHPVQACWLIVDNNARFISPIFPLIPILATICNMIELCLQLRNHVRDMIRYDFKERYEIGSSHFFLSLHPFVYRISSWFPSVSFTVKRTRRENRLRNRRYFSI